MTERERFEAWAESCGLEIITMADGDYYFSDTQSAWEAWQARCPEGWQVVPVKPSGKMYAAMKDPNHPGGIDFEALLKWDAVLAAAPQPGEEN